MDGTTAKRLALVRHLLAVGTEQSHQAEPANSVSLLSFHDAVELFLQLTTEHLNVHKPDRSFMAYWDVIEKKIGQPLLQQESMKRMNRARSQLKHHGVLPATSDVESFRVSTTNFFLENTPVIFGGEFESISLVDFVSNQEVRSKLQDAQNSIKNNQLKDALNEIALAFDVLVNAYKKNKSGYYLSPFYFGEDFTFHKSSHMQERGKMGEFIDRVGGAITPMQNAMAILCLGLDYRKYVKFKTITPHITHYIGGYHIRDPDDRELGDCVFCLDYVIESAIHLQRFDYDASQYLPDR